MTWVIQDALRFFSRRRKGSDGQYLPEEEVGPLPNGQFLTASPPGASPPSYTPWPSNIVGFISQYAHQRFIFRRAFHLPRILHDSPSSRLQNAPDFREYLK